MSPLFLIVIVMAVAMFLMSRSAKKKQAQALEMRNKMEPGSGVRTIGGMFALVKNVTDDAVELEIAPGVNAIYAKSAISTVLDPVEYNRIVHGEEPEDEAAEDTNAEGAEAVAAADEAPALEAGDTGAKDAVAKADEADATTDALAKSVVDAAEAETRNAEPVAFAKQSGGDKDGSGK